MDADVEQLRRVFAQQRSAFAAYPHPLLQERRAGLKLLLKALRDYQEPVIAAVNLDFCGRAASETRLVELLGPSLQLRHALAHLPRWMRLQPRHCESLLRGNRVWLQYQPKGVVGVMVPWHYPFNQALGPLVAALAAGNRVMILMSGLSPHSTVVLRQMLAQCFAPDEVAVFAGEAALTQSFLELPFDHLVFAGSSAAGRQVMRAAAEHLTPLTLTLGSKSPALLAPGAPLCAAAQSIAYGKAFNSAQGCMAPDYVLVAREQMLALVTELGLAFRHMYPQVSDNPDYTSVITDRHKARLCALLSDALLKGAQVVSCGEEDAGRRMPLQIVSGVRADMRIASEVVCGPLLPVIAYDSLEQALEWINARPRPLALYLYGFARAEWTRILRQTHSGGVAIDDCGWQGFNHDLPLGGIGDSGMGSYHGVEGFRALSHARAVFKRHPWFPMSGFHPPYGGWLQRLLLKFYLR